MADKKKPTTLLYEGAELRQEQLLAIVLAHEEQIQQIGVFWAGVRGLVRGRTESERSTARYAGEIQDLAACLVVKLGAFSMQLDEQIGDKTTIPAADE